MRRLPARALLLKARLLDTRLLDTRLLDTRLRDRRRLNGYAKLVRPLQWRQSVRTLQLSRNRAQCGVRGGRRREGTDFRFLPSPG